MKTQDLRIGNLLDNYGLMEVKAISKSNIRIYDHFNKMNNNHWISLKKFAPINVDDHFFKDFGFEKSGFGWQIDLKPFPKEYKKMFYGLDYLGIRNGKKDEPRENDEMIIIYNEDIRGKLQVHQLQNFYHQFTGNELVRVGG